MAQVINVASLNFEEFHKKFEDEEAKITKEIEEYIHRMADIKEYINCELFFHSKRQQIISSIHKYMNRMIVFQNSLEIYKSSVLSGIVNEASSNFNFKSSQEKMILIDGNNNVAQTKLFLDLFNNHINFLDESRKTLDGIIYNMKNRVEIQKQLDC